MCGERRAIARDPHPAQRAPDGCPGTDAEVAGVRRRPSAGGRRRAGTSSRPWAAPRGLPPTRLCVFRSVTPGGALGDDRPQ